MEKEKGIYMTMRPNYYRWLYGLDERRLPKNETLEEHLEHCKAENCPFLEGEKEERMQDESDEKTVMSGDLHGVNAEMSGDFGCEAQHNLLMRTNSEYRDVYSRYHGPEGQERPGWLKAPNGQNSHLDPIRWVQVRTPAFKKMFGDWEAAALRQQISMTERIQFERPPEGELREFIDGYRNGDREIQKRIVDWANSIVDHEVTNKYIGIVRNSKGSIRDTLNHARSGKCRGPLKVLIHQRLNNLLREAVLFDQRDDGDQHFFNLAHQIGFDGYPYLATISVLEDRNGNRTWTVEFLDERKIAETPTLGQGSMETNLHGKPSSPQSVNSILQNICSCNINVKGIVDENGEPTAMNNGTT